MELSINYIADKVCEYFLGKNADLKRNEEEALIQFEDVNYTASKVFGAIISASVFDSLADLVKIIYEKAEKVVQPAAASETKDKETKTEIKGDLQISRQESKISCSCPEAELSLAAAFRLR